MNTEAIHFVKDILINAPTENKQAVINYVLAKYNLTKDRTVYYCKNFAVRFNWSRNSSFPNTVLSLSKLQKFDNIPFFVILIRNNKNNIIYLSNSTFISKLSHSSRNLSISNIKGSFNGSDIIKCYAGLDNIPENFSDLFALHKGLDWEDNLYRIVEATTNINPRVYKFIPNKIQKRNIYKSISRAQEFIDSRHYNDLKIDLTKRCNKSKEAIFIASHIENKNLRGRLIEYLITSDDKERKRISSLIKEDFSSIPEFNTHDDLGDYIMRFDDNVIFTDIKTKIIYLNSSPKAYNIDKFLSKMAEDNTSFFFFFIGIDANGIFNTTLCSVYHNSLIDASILQHHWAGRASRGVVQFSGAILDTIIKQKDFINVIDKNKCLHYLYKLIQR